MPEVSRTTFGFSQIVTPLKPRFLAYSKAALTMRRAAFRVMMRTLTARSGPGTLVKALNRGMGIQRGANVVRRIGPLDAGVQALGALAEDRGVDLGLVEAAVDCACE